MIAAIQPAVTTASIDAANYAVFRIGTGWPDKYRALVPSGAYFNGLVFMFAAVFRFNLVFSGR
jgi:hypothetical protein